MGSRSIDSRQVGFIFGGVVLVIILRIFVWLHVGDPIQTDSHFYDQSALNMANGLGFSQLKNGVYEPILSHTPGYQLFLMPIYYLAQDNSAISQTSYRIQLVIMVQYFLGITAVGLFSYTLYLMTKQLKVVAGYLVLSAVYLPLTIINGLLLTETWAIFLLSGLSLLIWIWRNNYQWWRWLLIGILTGYLSLVRPQLLFIYPVYFIWVWVDGLRRKSTLIRNILIVGVGVFSVISLWTIRTERLTGEWVLMQAGVRYVLRTGTCPSGLCGSSIPLMLEQNDVGRERVRDQGRDDTDIGKLLWWYGVKKPRQLWSTAVGDRLLSFENQGTSWVVTTFTRIVQLLLFLAFSLGAILVFRSKHKLRLWLYWSLFGMLTMIFLWTDPRYLLPILPFMLGIVAYLGVELTQVYKGTRKIILQLNWRYLLLIIGVWLISLLVLLMPINGSYDGILWQWERLASGLFWGITLLFLGRITFIGVDYSVKEKVVAWLMVLLIWGNMIAVWPQIRAIILPSAPEDDYVFPVAIYENEKVLL